LAYTASPAVFNNCIRRGQRRVFACPRGIVNSGWSRNHLRGSRPFCIAHAVCRKSDVLGRRIITTLFVILSSCSGLKTLHAFCKGKDLLLKDRGMHSPHAKKVEHSSARPRCDIAYFGWSRNHLLHISDRYRKPKTVCIVQAGCENVCGPVSTHHSYTHFETKGPFHSKDSGRINPKIRLITTGPSRRRILTSLI
jgi:hypothetical protein